MLGPLKFVAYVVFLSVAGLSVVFAFLAFQSLADVYWLSVILAGSSVTFMTALFGFMMTAVAHHEALAAEALHQLPTGYFVASPTGKLALANRAAVALFPSRHSPLIHLREGTRGEDQARLMAQLESSALTGRTARLILRPQLREGRRSALEVSVTPMSSLPRRAIWRVEDVTAREEMRDLFDMDQRKLLDLFDQAPVGLYSIDDAGRFRMMNSMMASWLDSTPERLLRDGAVLQDYLLPELQPQTRTPFDPYEPAEWLEVVLRRPDGTLLKASISQTVERQGNRLTTRSVMRDLAHERTWEDAIRLVRQRFRRFFEIAPVGIALVEAGAVLKETNEALERLLTGDRAVLAGRDLFDFVADDARSEIAARLAAVWDGEQFSRPLEIRLKGAPKKTVELFVSRLEGEDGGGPGLILHFIDLTEQKSLELQFAQSQKMQAVGQLAGGIAHDFNNLLTAMIGFCDLLLLRFRPGDQSFADIMQIKQNANRAANLVRQLLAFSRQQTLQPKVIGIADVLSELSHLLNRLLGDNIELKMVHGRNLGPVRVDQGQLEQVIINLAVNARDAMPGGGVLTIRTAAIESAEPIEYQLETMPAGAYVLIEVSDEGVGIPRDILPRIFEPFFSTKEVGSGTGLGLSTVYGIVKQTGGFIFVDSTPGVGTRFSIYLPGHLPTTKRGDDVAAIEVPEPAVPRDLTGAGTILLVEDEDPVRLFLTRALRNKGYNVLEARGGEAALKIIDGGCDPLDIVITDVVMPRMDGPTLIKHVRERLPAVKVIFISGYAEDAFRKRVGDQEDVSYFLSKPFSLKELAAKVKEVMDARLP
jgi:two-component system cell cycle sensor histidine kinase/response regulator CckA